MSKVSIIIPYSKDRGWLNDAIRSAENQTYKDVEIVISQGKGGVSKNINKGIEKSNGDFIKYLCEDDLLDIMSIENSLKGFKIDTDFIHGKAKSFTDLISKGFIYEPTKKNLNLNALLKHNHIHGGTLMYRRRVFEEIGMFNESLWTGEEYEFNLRALYHNCKIDYVDKVVYYYRIHKEQKSIGNTNQDYQLMRKKHIMTFKGWYEKNS